MKKLFSAVLICGISQALNLHSMQNFGQQEMTNLDAEAGVYYQSGSDSSSRTKFDENWSVSVAQTSTN